MLCRGLDLADRCGATGLGEARSRRARGRWRKPRRVRMSGVEASTPSERRVAQLAGAGMTNRDIAQALFVTLRTVERHLTSAYDKLAARGRSCRRS